MDEENLGSNMQRPIVRIGDTVHRPAKWWTPTVHKQLEHRKSAYQQIFSAHRGGFDFAGKRNDPVLVVFSAIPGSGKSELTRRLVDNYGFLRVANKDIRRAIEQAGCINDVEIGSYTLWLFNHLVENGPVSIVFDRNIDQWYEPIKAWAANHSYKFLVVQIEVPRQRLKERLLEREGSPTAKVFNVLDFYDEQHEEMKTKLHPGISLEGDFDLDKAARRITEQLLIR